MWHGGLPIISAGSELRHQKDKTMAVKDELTLRLHSGIPVVEIGGEWSAALSEAVATMLASLQHAGHFEIVLNVQRAVISSMGGTAGLRSLAGEAQAFRSHHGHLDIVGTVEQIEELVRGGLASLFRLASSEEVALSRIKRTPVLASGPRFTARTLE
jgi:anti-anti-sigma factor